MAKKNFDAFINAAGKKPKLSPEEVEAMAKQLHQPSVQAPAAKVEAQPKEEKTPKRPKPAAAVVTKPATAVEATAKASRDAMPPEAPKEKVRITIDLAKDLYKRMKLAVVHNETEISAYIRGLIESDLAKQQQY